MIEVAIGTKHTIVVGDVLDALRTLPDESVHCVVTSPPYWGLRDYKLEPQVWGGESGCEHEWGDPVRTAWANAVPGPSNNIPKNILSDGGHWKPKLTGPFCLKCSAWRGSLGLEPTPDLYVQHLVEVFREVRRVLRSDGTVWLNLGDSYASQGGPEPAQTKWQVNGASDTMNAGRSRTVVGGLKPKDLVGIPWRVAFALQQPWRSCLACGSEAHEGSYGRVKMHDGRLLFVCPSCGASGGARITELGWWLRSDIIWAKPNPMPESVTDRPTKSHEYILLFAKNGNSTLLWRARDTKEWSHTPDLSEKIIDADGKETPRWRGYDYYYDHIAILEPSVTQDPRQPYGSDGAWQMDGRPREKRHGGQPRKQDALGKATYTGFNDRWRQKPVLGRNKRTVWTVAPKPYPEAHFATFPEELIKPCVLAGTSAGGVVLDPFAGSGTTMSVAAKHGRNSIGIELQEKYIPLIRKRMVPLVGDLVSPARIEEVRL